MDLWIRSQDKKTLMKITRLYIFSNSIFSVDTRENEIILGTYKKDKRALEVLNEIQNILQPKVIWREPKTGIKYGEGFMQTMANDMVIQTTQQVEYDLKQAGQIVYEMPKE